MPKDPQSWTVVLYPEIWLLQGREGDGSDEDGDEDDGEDSDADGDEEDGN